MNSSHLFKGLRGAGSCGCGNGKGAPLCRGRRGPARNPGIQLEPIPPLHFIAFPRARTFSGPSRLASRGRVQESHAGKRYLLRRVFPKKGPRVEWMLAALPHTSFPADALYSTAERIAVGA